jgi:hypothetical protein
MHQLRDESAALLQTGGLWKYCNDAHESLQYLAKKTWMNHSARGAANRTHPTGVVCQRHFMMTHLCTMEDGPHCLQMLKAEQRKLEEMQQLADADITNEYEAWNTI